MSRSLPPALFALALLSCGGAPLPPPGVSHGTPPAPAPDPDAAPPALRIPGDEHPLSYALDLRVLPGEPRFSGTATIRVRLDRARRTVWLHGHGLHVTEAHVGDAPAHYEEAEGDEGFAALHVVSEVPAGETTITIAYDAPFATGGDAVFAAEEDGRHYAFTQFEPISARVAFPCFDEPGFKTPFDLSLVVRKDEVAIANTPEASSEDVDAQTKRVRFQTTPPLPTYLVAFAVGPLDVVVADPIPPTDVRQAPLPLRGVAMHGRGERLRFELSHVAPIVQALERYFGSAFPYPKLDVVAIVDFPGAMENAGCVTFDEWLLLVDEHAASEDQLRAAENTIAHELSHQWFGDLVTMAWWDDLWLNEAFATWMANGIVQEVRPAFDPDAQRIAEWNEAMDADAHGSARRIRQPIVSHHDISSAFDGITYSKGSAVIAMIEHWVGADVFKRGVRAYLDAHRYGTATADDLLTALSAAAERDVATPFRTFLDQPGSPLVHERFTTPAPGHLHWELSQERFLPLGSHTPHQGLWQVPVCVGGLATAGPTQPFCVLLTETRAEGDLDVDAHPLGAIRPNDGGLGYYESTLEPTTALMAVLHGPVSVRDAAVVVASIDAGFDTGAVGYADAMTALAPLAARPERLLAEAPMGLAGWAHERVADDALRARIEAWARRLYAPQLRRLGWQPRRGATEDGDTKLMRASVISFLTDTARDPAVRAEAARRGRAFVGFGGDGHMHGEAVLPDLADTALSVAVEDGDAALFDAVLAQLEHAEDPAVRATLISALGAAQDPALAERARALTLDPRLTATEVLIPLRSQLHDRRQRAAAWAYLKEHYVEVLARIPVFAAGYVPHVAAVFCDAASRADAEAFFGARAAGTPGAPQSLAEALEQVDLCAAKVEAQGASARSFFAQAR